ncbi:tryptophan synthase beta subunit-like PLP-dependent enzyme [Phlebopus sp. FC_14]|nr:tryptophan synthase beta subunit-like PLP-dependent enzyme [Phlebopus sp. FC_14]
MSAEDVQSSNPWTETPLIYSSHISDLLGCSVYLKLETLQPSQSFKYRGVALSVQRFKAKYGPTVHVLIASGGNAGLAAAVAARKAGIKCTVYLPLDVSEGTRATLRKQGAEIVRVGQIYAEAVAAMREAAQADPSAVTLSAYDDPVLWEGHSSMVSEMKSQLRQKPDAILCSVGGGGLIGGVLLGCKKVGWDDDSISSQVPIVALETHGSNCFYHANALNTQEFTSKIPSLPTSVPPDAPYTVDTNNEYQVAVPYMRALTSRAASLGATYAAPGVVRLALDHRGGVNCVCIPDDLAMYGALAFANDHKILLELACSTTLSAAYSRELFWRILDPMSELLCHERQKKSVIFVVCGGVKITYAEMAEYGQILDDAAQVEKEWRVVCNGTEYRIPR